jgi:hypothetical protein
LTPPENEVLGIFEPDELGAVITAVMVDTYGVVEEFEQVEFVTVLFIIVFSVELVFVVVVVGEDDDVESGFGMYVAVRLDEATGCALLNLVSLGRPNVELCRLTSEALVDISDAGAG